MVGVHHNDWTHCGASSNESHTVLRYEITYENLSRTHFLSLI